MYKPYVKRPVAGAEDKVKRKTGKRPVYHHRHHHYTFSASDEEQVPKRQVSETVTVAESTVTVVVQPSECVDHVASASTPTSSWLFDGDINVDYSPASTPEEARWWELEGYYMDNVTAGRQEASQQSGIVWLNNMGKNGLTLASADGTSGSDKYQTFNGELGSQQEIALFSASYCEYAAEWGGDCGFVRPGAVGARM